MNKRTISTAARIAALQDALRLLEQEYSRGLLDVGRYIRLKLHYDEQLITLNTQIRYNIENIDNDPVVDAYFHPDSQRLRAIFHKTLARQMGILKPGEKSVSTFSPLVQDLLVQERLSSKGLSNLLAAKDLLPLSWSDFCGLNASAYEKHVVDKEITIYCPFPLLTFLAMLLYLRELRSYHLDIRYHLTTLEGVKKVEQNIEPVDVFVGSDIQATSVLNDPTRYDNPVPIMLLPPGELPTMLYPYKGTHTTPGSGIFFAPDGTSSQAEITRGLRTGRLNERKLAVSIADKVDYLKVLRSNPEEARIVSWEPFGLLLTDYLEPNAVVVANSLLYYVLFFSKDFITRDFMAAYALAISLTNTWYTLVNNLSLAVDLLMSDEQVLLGFARLHQSAREQ